jgi:UDP-glucose 4-epimerase
MEMSENKQKLAVVTGGAGFIGSHLCERLVRDGHRVISLDNYFTGSPENHIDGVEYRTGHTKDIAEHIPETPDIIYHLGEYSRTEKSFEDMELVWDLNKTGTFSVLEFWRRKKCKLVYAGSSTKFADGGEGRDQSPYAWTKASNTELVMNYAEWFGLSFAITYFYNVYGPRERSGAYGTLISIFAAESEKGQPLTVVSPGTQVRNFTHVSDIVDGLFLVGEKGNGDGYGIGAPASYTIQSVAEMFGGEILMMPERKGNRMTSSLHTERTESLGWSPKYILPEYIDSLKKRVSHPHPNENRVIIFSTTFYPDAGKAELALYDLIEAMPSVHFDVVTTRFSKQAEGYTCPLPNVTIHRVGYGRSFDKYLLPVLGARLARRLTNERAYLFEWALFASYGAVAAIISRGNKKIPLLITIADQKLANIPFHVRIILQYILSKADQVYADDTYESRTVLSFMKRLTAIRSIGSGDAFANQIRFTYSVMLKKQTTNEI